MGVPLVQKVDQSRRLGCLELDKVRFRSSPRALARCPIPSSGPTWPGRLVLETRSLPSVVVDRRHGQDHVLQARMGARTAKISRSSIGSASLPQTSPAWILPMIRQISLPDRRPERPSSPADRPRSERDRPPFRRAAELGEMSERGRPWQTPTPRGHIVVTRGRAIVTLRSATVFNASTLALSGIWPSRGNAKAIEPNT